VKSAALVTLRHASAVARLAGAKLSEVLCCAWNDVLVQLKGDAAKGLAWHEAVVSVALLGRVRRTAG